MDATIIAFLTQDGLITGAIYALLAVAIVLVFTVTRVIFVPQGEFVSFAALTMAAFQSGTTPGTVWLVLMVSAIALAMELVAARREGDAGRALRAVAWFGLAPLLLAGGVVWLASPDLPLVVQALMTFALVVPLGPILYRVAYQPVAQASTLVLLIISVALHLALNGFGLIVFGPEGARTPAFSDATWTLGPLQVTGQSVWVLVATAGASAALFWFFNNSFRGKALKATAVNRVGAQLMGISATSAGIWAFTLAAAIGALSGLLIGPITTIFYDTGFLFGLKGFVAAIIGGLASYPLAAFGAVLVGLLESFSSFWASAYKEVLVFTLIIPVLVWRSLTSHHVEEEE